MEEEEGLSTNYKRQMWESRHHRFGLAGEGQADIIQECLERKRGRVLDIGCGPLGDRVKMLASCSDYIIAADNSYKLARMALETAGDLANANFVVGDALRLCLGNESIDHIVALGLFAHIKVTDTLRVLSEFFRVCRAGGNLMMTNAVVHPKERYVAVGLKVGFELVLENEAYCPQASGSIKRRYLLVLAKR